METKFTLGQWIAEEVWFNAGQPNSYHAWTVQAKGPTYSHCVAEIKYTGIHPKDEISGDEANARLIAAAPELVAALQSIRDAYQQHFDVMPVAWQTYDEIARTALAKAGGQS